MSYYSHRIRPIYKHIMHLSLNKKNGYEQRYFGNFSLVDLGEDNDRNLKMPSQIAAEKAAAASTFHLDPS